MAKAKGAAIDKLQTVRAMLIACKWMPPLSEEQRLKNFPKGPRNFKQLIEDAKERREAAKKNGKED